MLLNFWFKGQCTHSSVIFFFHFKTMNVNIYRNIYTAHHLKQLLRKAFQQNAFFQLDANENEKKFERREKNGKY